MLFDVMGGSGFIGTSLCTLFDVKNYDFRIIDKLMGKKFPGKTCIADIRSLHDLRNNIRSGSIIINLAAEHRDDVRPSSLYYDVNVNGSKNICQVANEKQVNRIIFTSTVAVYGFAPIGTNESGNIQPFNEYGKTKFAAENIYREWQAESPEKRSLIIIRPTVVFGEKNRGNVFNLLRQIASGRFLMIGDGNNRKSIAYVDNIAAFIEYSSALGAGVHLFNYVDKPDFTMNMLVGLVRNTLGKSSKVRFRAPYFFGYSVGRLFDFYSYVSGKKVAISSIRIKKFCSDSVYETLVTSTSFIPPVTLYDALEKTIRYEFIDLNNDSDTFISE